MDEIIIEDKLVAGIVGINLKPIDFREPKALREYLKNIIEINDGSYKRIFIEDINQGDVDIKEVIESETSLSFPTGKEIRYYNIPLIIRDVARIMKVDMSQQEVLLIVDKKEDALDIIDIVRNTFNFISLIGIRGEEAEELYEEVLDKTGISIFQPIDVEKTINNYEVIINQSEFINLNLDRIRKKSIIFDYSIYKPFKEAASQLVIYDVIISLRNLGIERNPWIEDKVCSEVYEGLFEDSRVEYCQISTETNFHHVEDYFNQAIKIKGGL